MTRYVSLGVLIAVIVLLCIVFYQVMASFLLPLFLATVLVVVFRPLHEKILGHFKDKPRISSAVTTGIICLAVIVPCGIVGLIAFGEARQIFRTLTAGGIEQNVKRIRKSLELEMPAAQQIHALEDEVQRLDTRNLDEYRNAEEQLARIEDASDRMEKSLLRLAVGGDLEPGEIPQTDAGRWHRFRQAVIECRKVQQKFVRARNEREKRKEAAADKQKEQDNRPAEPGPGENGKRDDRELTGESYEAIEAEYRRALDSVGESFQEFRVQLLGGPVWAYLKEIANPRPEEFARYSQGLSNWIKENFLSLTGRATQLLFSLVFNGLIMIVAVYFFLLDGHRMITAIKYFSPMDDRHEQELIDEFGKVSRAVVVATLAAAAVQGLLAGIGFYFAGVEAVFLLMMLTGIAALVPFIGAAAIWFPTCVYLYLIEDQLIPAVLLFIWGAAVVSTVDNLIKPLILHGQSNIHPLLGLLSVLGGVAALGPIGILVGPMVVAFLQTMLGILQRELVEMDRQTGSSAVESDRQTGSSAVSADQDQQTDQETSADKPASGVTESVEETGRPEKTEDA